MAYAVIARKNKGEINMTNIDLAQMGAGQSGKVITMHGGRGMTAVGNTQVAIGFGMARRVIVALEV
jgi:hypothetical protein